MESHGASDEEENSYFYPKNVGITLISGENSWAGSIARLKIVIGEYLKLVIILTFKPLGHICS